MHETNRSKLLLEDSISGDDVGRLMRRGKAFGQFFLPGCRRKGQSMACVAKRRGKWIIDFYDTRGKRRWKTLPTGTTKKKAVAAMRDIEDRLAKGIYLPDNRIPRFSEVAADWLKQKESNVRQSTWRKYEAYLKSHFTEVLDIKVNRITTAKVEEYITKRQSEGMNLTSLRKLIVTFNQVMKYAVRHRYIDYNPVRDAERPKDQGEFQEEVATILTPDQIQCLLDAVADQKHKTLFMLAITSGARQGELFGLKWTDVDWFNSQLQIRRTFNEGAWYRPKSKTSNRNIDLGPAMMKELKRWRVACPPSELGLIFPSEAGGPLDHGNMIQRNFYPAFKTANKKLVADNQDELPRIRFHDLRHTYASLLIDQGENIKYIQSQLGHASPMVTLSIYAHLMKPVNQASACRLENTLFSTKNVESSKINESVTVK